MRAPTAHERMSVNSYVRKISHNTGVNFFEIIASNYDQGQIKWGSYSRLRPTPKGRSS